LGQTIGNLIQNAVLHGFDGRDHGTVRIDGERAPDGWIVLRVADDGEGIAAEHLGRLFDPFMTVKMGGGTGLGLHISYNAVTGLLGGTLTVRSTVGEGTVFELRLPTRAPVHVDAPQQVGSGAVVPPAA
jgi:signal transduction histidine kinase